MPGRDAIARHFHNTYPPNSDGVVRYYVIDRHLDNSKAWMAGTFKCARCGRDSAITFREDVEPFCPLCTKDQKHRVTPRRVDAAEA